MASLHVSPEELSCPVCRKILKSPVLLSCNHSFCKECLQQFWRSENTQECPVCRRRSSREFNPPYMALNNLSESFLKERDESRPSGSEEICSLHSEKLKLFCVEDNQPVCVVCRDSQQHANHTFRPISEIGPSYKVELKSLKEKPKHKENIKGEKTVQHTKTSDESTQSLTQSNTTQSGSPDSPNVPPLCTPEISRHTLAPKRRAEQDITEYQRCVLNATSNKPDEEEHFLLSLGDALRELPPHSRSEVKLKFQQILHDAEFNNQ